MLSGQESEGTREEASYDRADETDFNLMGLYRIMPTKNGNA